MLSAERRASPRLSLPEGHWATYTGGAGVVRDLSLRGIRIEGPNPVAVGTVFKLNLHLADDVLFCRGVVRHVIPTRAMGIEFVDLSPREKDRLRDCARLLLRR
jgi:hypothetical protein